MFWGWGYPGYYVSDDNDKPKDCYRHKYEEIPLVGVHTYWQCANCEHNKKFEDIEQKDDIIKRCSMHKLPWEKK